MADYAGEPRRIVTDTARNFDGRVLVPADVQSVTVEVFTNDLQTVVLPVTPMDYIDDTGDVDNNNWAFIWDTTGLEPGTYKAKVVITTLDGLESFEYKRIRLARDPHPGP